MLGVTEILYTAEAVAETGARGTCARTTAGSTSPGRAG
jgi:hypothetical protein